MTPDLSGLTTAEVEDRRARGLGNDIPDSPSRTITEILRANVLTPFNALLGSLLAVVLVTGEYRDALFGGVIVSNALIGIVQEWRAKRTLDRLAILSAPRARVVRGGEATEVPISEVVKDDLLDLEQGDQIVVDGEVVSARGLEVDESLLTGESEPEVKEEDGELLSGSFVVAGSGHYRATRVGRDAYAVQLAEEARRFTLVSSELRDGINRIIKGVSLILVPTAVLLLWSQLVVHDDDLSEALRSTVGGVVAMVPEGLVLLTSVAFAAGVVRLGRRQALVQELAAVETLARVDVVCVDKTGTVTEGNITLNEVEACGSHGREQALTALAALAEADPNPNATLHAIAVHQDVRDVEGQANGWAATVTVPFSSGRKWSGAMFDGRGTWLLGAPEVLLAGVEDEHQAGDAERTVDSYAADGNRVVLLARSDGEMDGPTLPPTLEPAAVLVLADQVRSDAPATLRYFADQGVTVKVISGDNADTVAAVARKAGVEGAERGIDTRGLSDSDLAEAALCHNVFGRVTPHQKRLMVNALRDAGHVVAMTGDGVNDALALKDADMGIAMGSGSAATRAVAQLVLLDSSFATMPEVLSEGRRVINNVERVANLFLTKTTYASLLAITVGIAQLPFPFLPRHLTLIGSLTIGIPGFFLALAPSTQLVHPGFVRRVLRVAVPAGVLAAGATFITYYLGREVFDLVLNEARAAATLVLVAFALFLLWQFSNPITAWRGLLIGAMGGGIAVAVLTPFGREFFELELPPADMWVAGTAVLATVMALWFGLRWRWPEIDPA